MTVEIKEHEIKAERYSVLAQAFESLMKKMGYDVKINCNTTLKNTPFGPQTYITITAHE